MTVLFWTIYRRSIENKNENSQKNIFYLTENSLKKVIHFNSLTILNVVTPFTDIEFKSVLVLHRVAYRTVNVRIYCEITNLF